MKLLLFAFQRSISESVLNNIKFPNKFIIPNYRGGHAKGIDKLLEFIKKENPEFILGLGRYSRSGTKLRLETISHNLFKKEEIGTQAQFKLHNFVGESESFSIGDNMGNSWCNLVSYKIMELIDYGEIQSRYSFIHIPKKFDIKKASDILQKIVKEINGDAYTLYILRCSDNTLYTGITNDLEHRLEVHRSGKGAKYVRTRLPFKLVYQEELPDKSSALKREIEIKNLTRSKKEELLN